MNDLLLNKHIITKEEYDNLVVPSYSLLKELEKHPINLRLALEGHAKPETDSMLLGNVFDAIISYNMNKYLVYEGTLPKNKMLDIANKYIEMKKIDFTTSESDDELCLLARSAVGYNENLKPETFIRKFNEECKAYVDTALSNKNKVIIPKDLYETAYNLVKLLHLDYSYRQLEYNATRILRQTHLVANIKIASEVKSMSKNKTNNYKENYKESYKEYTVKGTPDVVFIDDIRKTVTIIDYKTTQVRQFESNYINYRYFIQEVLYIEILKSIFPDYEVTFFFIVLDTNFVYPIEWFASSLNVKYVAMYGGTVSITSLGTHVYDLNTKGIYRLIEDFYWHVNNSMFDHSTDYYLRNFNLI